MTEHEDCVQRKLRAKKAAGIPINDQAVAISISECNRSTKSKNSGNDMFQPFEINTKIVELL